MKFRDLQKQYHSLKPQLDTAISEVLEDTNFISGRQVRSLEERLAEYVGVKHCLTCANGTDALSMVLMAWGIKKGDAVFVPDFTFFASGEVVSFAGATPVFVDIDPNTYNLDPECLEKRIQEVIEKGELIPKAVICVDLFGLPADYPKISVIAAKYRLKILEDGAQGFGGMIGDRRACSFGDAATTSFFPAKPLGCYGDGGAVFTDDGELADYIQSVRVHGMGSYKYDNVRIGWNSRLDTLQAAVLSVKLDAFIGYELQAADEMAAYYSSLLQDVVTIPMVPEGYHSSWAQYTIRLESETQRTGLERYLKESDIPSMVYYPIPMHKQKAFKDAADDKRFPVTEHHCDTVLSLPFHPYLEKSDAKTVAMAILEYMDLKG